MMGDRIQPVTKCRNSKSDEHLRKVHVYKRCCD